MKFVTLNAFTENTDSFRLDHLTLSDGLPSSSVSKILQDSNGFMWFATQSGLSKYDGYSFKTFLYDPFDKNSLPHNLVQTMYLDDNNVLWLGTYSGLSRFDTISETFINFQSNENDYTTLSDDVVVSIERDNDGILWVGTLDGLNMFDESTSSFIRYYNDPEDNNSIPSNIVRSILNDDEGNLWIGTAYGGLSLWNRNSKNFSNFLYNKKNPHSIPSTHIMDIKKNFTACG